MLLTVTLVAVLQLPPVWTDWVIVSGEKFEFAISQAELERQPRWSEIRDDPPLAPRQAVLSAESLLQLIFANRTDWRLSSVLLRPSAVADVWFYVIEFDEIPPPPPPPSSPFEGVGGSQYVPHIRVPVLMDGTAVEPTRRAWPEK